MPIMRTVLQTLAACLVLASAANCQQPNILLILADDLGYGDVSCYNSESRVATRNVDRLAEAGMRFTDAHSPSTVCTPTRYSVLTGRMAFRLDYRGVFTGAGGPCLIEPERLTLPGMLRQQGYATAMFGKWHIGLTFFDADGQAIHQNGLPAVRRIDYSRAIPDAPIHRGFDQFFGTACCPTTDWLYAFIDGDRVPVPPSKLLDRSKLPKHAWANDCRRGLVAEDFDHEEVDMVFLERSLRFLTEHHEQKPDQPFFLFHSMQAVHLPSFASKQFQGKSAAGPHGDFLLQFDHIVGALLDKLDELKIADNTLVILTSDNGPEVPTVIHMRADYQHDGARPWRGMKRDNWEGGHRVPLIARWPGHVPAGTTSEQTACLTDLMATCAAITAAEMPAGAAEDSFDLLPALLGKATHAIREFTLHQTISLALAIRQGDWKYLDHKGSGGNNYQKNQQLAPFALPDAHPEARGQLYNLKTDPGETNNLCAQHPEVVKRLQELLQATIASGRSAPVPSPKTSLAKTSLAKTFAWPAPATAVITEVTTNKGRTAKSRYKMQVMPGEDGQGLRIRHQDFQFLEVAGEDATTAPMQKLLAAATTMSSVVPDYRITADGRFAEICPIDETLQRLRPMMRERFDAPEQLTRFEQQFQQPEFASLMQRTLRQSWQGCVEHWLDWQVPAGKTVQRETEIELFGTKVPAKLTLTHHGDAVDHVDHVRLGVRIVAEGPKVLAALKAALVQSDAVPLTTDRHDYLQRLTSAQSVRSFEVITRFDSLRPVWASIEVVNTLGEAGQEEPRVQVERHEYRISWAQ
jgi:arylsulfatase A